MHIALYQPDIPPNTGTIIRMAACLDVHIHIIEPCGFPFGEAGRHGPHQNQSVPATELSGRSLRPIEFFRLSTHGVRATFVDTLYPRSDLASQCKIVPIRSP